MNVSECKVETSYGLKYELRSKFSQNHRSICVKVAEKSENLLSYVLIDS